MFQKIAKKKHPSLKGVFFIRIFNLYYLELLFAEALLAAVFLVLEEALAFLQQDFFAVDLEQQDNCSTAIDQNFSSCPLGQPAFCHK